MIELSQRVWTHKGETTQIILRKVTTGDYIDIGEIDTVYVLEIDDSTKRPTKFEHALNREALMEWMVRLSGIDRLILRELPLVDGKKLMAAVRSLVMEFVQAGNSQSAPESPS